MMQPKITHGKGTGLGEPITKRQWSRLGHINVTESHRARAMRELVKIVQNVGMPVKVGIDVDAHRLNLAFNLPDSGKQVDKMLFQLFDFLRVSHRYSTCPDVGRLK